MVPAYGILGLGMGRFQAAAHFKRGHITRGPLFLSSVLGPRRPSLKYKDRPKSGSCESLAYQLRLGQRHIQKLRQPLHLSHLPQCPYYVVLYMQSILIIQ